MNTSNYLYTGALFCGLAGTDIKVEVIYLGGVGGRYCTGSFIKEDYEVHKRSSKS